MSQIYSKEEAHQKVADLVSDFQAVEPTIGESQESQIEEDYIRPLFSYLNWSVQSPRVPDSQKEVLLVKTDRRGKRPDYTFQHNGQRLFYMDAKKVKYDVRTDPRWLWQVYKYGWLSHADRRSHQVDFGVVTDFQEFVLLDCRFKVEEPKAVLPLRVWQWDCADYVNQFDKLWDVFERNNMVQASRDRKTGLWSYGLSPKQAKANRIPPDKGFLDKLDNETTGWRIRLAKDMKRCNPRLTGEVITSAVQLLIDRLVFIKALSDRSIEEDYLAKLAAIVEANGLGENDRGWFKAAQQPIFDRLNKFYNGSMFAPRVELDAVVTSNRAIRQIVRELDPQHSPYDLGILPVHILGTVYERFLGKVVRTTDQRVKIEEKPEVRKAGGVFYTPEYIVTNIVEQTVGKLLAGCTTPADVAKLKVLDPACGSGSFLIGAYDALIEWYKNYYTARTKPDRDAAYRDADGDILLTAKLKRQILLNNIFGVDIDQQAVEVTRFSLSLKALEDTLKEELDEERNLFKETVLPDLSANIQCGNSLVSTDLDMSLFATDEDRKRINPMSYKQRFESVLNSGGFHAIIGNPPYVRQEGLKELKGYLQQHYEAFSGTADLYTYFMERSINLLRPCGRYAMIVSSSFLRATYAAPLRNALKKKAAILRVVDFGGHAVFADAKDTYVCIPVFTKAAQPDRVEICRIAAIGPESVTDQMRKTDYTIPHERLSSEAWPLKSDAEMALFEKVVRAGKPLGDYLQGRMYYGIKTGLNEAFVINSQRRAQLIAEDSRSEELIHPLRGGDEIREYHILPGDEFIIFTRRGVKIDNYPAIKAHLEHFRPDLTPKRSGTEKCGRKPGAYRWYEIQDDVAYYQIFEQPKIVFPDICKHPRFCYDETGIYLANTAYALGTSDKYLLGILNSRLFWFAIANISIPFGVRAGKFRYRLIYQYMEKIPVRPINHDDPTDKSRHDRMVSLVEQMLEAKKQWASAQTERNKIYYAEKCKTLDGEIDALVYELYGLTEDEIHVVESAV